jgi:hypothetical protein
MDLCAHKSKKTRAAKLTGEVGLPKKPRTLEGNDENVIVQLD